MFYFVWVKGQRGKLVPEKWHKDYKLITSGQREHVALHPISDHWDRYTIEQLAEIFPPPPTEPVRLEDLESKQ